LRELRSHSSKIQAVVRAATQLRFCFVSVDDGRKNTCSIQDCKDERPALVAIRRQSLHHCGSIREVTQRNLQRVAHRMQYFSCFFRMGQDTTIVARCAM